MESLFNLVKLLLFFYLGIFTFITYQIIFYHQKRFQLLKTLVIFFIYAIIIIFIMNKYHLKPLKIFMFFYIFGIISANKFFKIKLLKLNQNITNNFKPIKKILRKILIIIWFPKLYYYLKNKIKLHKYYHKHPHKKPKSLYELY